MAYDASTPSNSKRYLQVKCDSGEQQTGSNCSRCHRLGLTCLREKKSWANAADDEAWQNQLTISKLERALEDVLEKLDLPALDLYVTPAIVKPRHPPRPTRPNSEERGERERDVSPDPMNSLIEATQLNGLRSQLRSSKQRRKGGMRRMDHDLIAEKVITKEEAEELLALFQKTQSHYLFSASVPSDATVQSIRSSSTVLFTAIMLVTALLIPGKEALHEACHMTFVTLVVRPDSIKLINLLVSWVWLRRLCLTDSIRLTISEVFASQLSGNRESLLLVAIPRYLRSHKHAHSSIVNKS